MTTLGSIESIATQNPIKAHIIVEKRLNELYRIIEEAQEEICKLEPLELQLKYMPGGEEYQTARKEFL